MKPTNVLIACTLAALVAVTSAQSSSPQPWYQSFVDWNQQALNTIFPANNAIQNATGTDLAALSPQPWYQSFVDWNQQAAKTIVDWNQQALNTIFPANNAIQNATGTDLASDNEKWKDNAANNTRNTVGKGSVDRARRYA